MATQDAKNTMSIGVAKKAAAYEAKYQRLDLLSNEPLVITVPIESCAVHQINRGGFYTQGGACESLLTRLLKDGFVLERHTKLASPSRRCRGTSNRPST